MPDKASRQFDRDVQSVGAARHFASETARRWGLDARDIALVVGELAANAVVHGGSAFVVSLQRDQRVSVEVSDLGTEVPTAVLPAGRGHGHRLQGEHGRGFEIVDHLVSAWGVRPVPEGGKVVWACIDS